MNFSYVTRRCTHEDIFKTHYEEGSTNRKFQLYKEQKKLCSDCWKLDLENRKAEAEQNFKEYFSPSPEWDGSCAQGNFASSIWVDAFGRIQPSHPQFDFARALAAVASERKYPAGVWIDAWMGVRRWWPRFSWGSGWVDLSNWFGEALDSETVCEAWRRAPTPIPPPAPAAAPKAVEMRVFKIPGFVYRPQSTD